MKRFHWLFVILVTTVLTTFMGCKVGTTTRPGEENTGEENRTVRHAAIVIDGSEQFGTYEFGGATLNYLPFDVYVPFINPDLIPSYAIWHWGNQGGSFSLRGKKWPVGKVKFQCGKVRTTQGHYEDLLIVEVYYQQRLSRFDHNGKLHYQYQPIESPLAVGTLNIVCWGKKW